VVGPGDFTARWTYANLEKNDAEHLNYLVVGPWNHGGWAHGPGNWLGRFHLPATGRYFREKVEPVVCLLAHDKGELPLKEALPLPDRESNTWTRFDAWPPRDAQTKACISASREIKF